VAQDLGLQHAGNTVAFSAQRRLCRPQDFADVVAGCSAIQGFRARDVGTIRGSGSLAADAQSEVVERIQAVPVGVPDEAT
jgi:hypothetical protein